MNLKSSTRLEELTTEQPNPASSLVDTMSALEIVRLINTQDQAVALAVEKQAEQIAEAVDLIVSAMQTGGRLIYMGAGTSGRLGVLDASECPPTFNTAPEQVIGLIAGGHGALVRAIEGAEDNPDLGKEDLVQANLKSADIVCGIATSGRTPYVLGGLQHAREVGCNTIGVACNRNAELSNFADVLICPVVGPEVVGGSTRMKAGTATKLVLNSLTTTAMIRLGKTYGNLMVDLRATNTKLRERSIHIVCAVTGLGERAAKTLLTSCGGEVKTAIVSEMRNISSDEAREFLARSNGHLRTALNVDAE